MTQRFYRPRFDKQLTGTPCGKANCNMCAAGRFVARDTLGLSDPTGDQMRLTSGTSARCTDSDPHNDGTNIKVAADVLARLHVNVEVKDNLTMRDVFGALDGGRSVILHGDYDQVPLALRGDREFLGLHSVFLNEHDTTRDRTLVYDSLDDGRSDKPTGKTAPSGPIWWPDWVVRKYAEAFPGTPIVAILGRRKRIVATVPVARVRSGPSRKSRTLAYVRQAGTPKSYAAGGTIPGETIGGRKRWYRVWVPSLARFGYSHESVVKLVID